MKANEQRIEDAIEFLLHPDIRLMSDLAKREFLVKKGFSEQEIDRAFNETVKRQLASGNQSSGALFGFSLKALMLAGGAAYLTYAGVKHVVQWANATGTSVYNSLSQAASSVLPPPPTATGQSASYNNNRIVRLGDSSSSNHNNSNVYSQEEFPLQVTLRSIETRLGLLETRLGDLSNSLEGVASLRQEQGELRKQVNTLWSLNLSKVNFPPPSYLGSNSSDDSHSSNLTATTTKLPMNKPSQDVIEESAAVMSNDLPRNDVRIPAWQTSPVRTEEGDDESQ